MGPVRLSELVDKPHRLPGSASPALPALPVPPVCGTTGLWTLLRSRDTGEG